MWLFIESLDVLLFRDSKPFAAGESVWARSIFPPNSLPFMGALRAKILVDNDIKFEDYHKFFKKDEPIADSLKQKIQTIVDFSGGAEDYGNLTLTGPFLSRQRSANQFISFFPAPLDVMSGENRVKYLKPQNFEWEIKTSKALMSKTEYNFSMLPLWTDESGDLPEEKFVKASGIINYLKGLSRVEIEEANSIWGNEFQVGIEKGAQRTAEIGKIYSVEFVRLKEEILKADDTFSSCGFLVHLPDIDEIRFKTEGFVALGGEGRTAKYTEIEETEISNLSSLIQGDFLINSLRDEKRFKLYLATPAIFSNGWYPDFLKAENGDLVGETGGLKFKLISASVNKPTTVSGWNLVKNRPRPLVKAVPAGSIYHFELSDDDVFDKTKIGLIRSKFHFKTLTGKGKNAVGNIPENDLKEYGKAGFGLALVGKI